MCSDNFGINLKKLKFFKNFKGLFPKCPLCTPMLINVEKFVICDTLTIIRPPTTIRHEYFCCVLMSMGAAERVAGKSFVKKLPQRSMYSVYYAKPVSLTCDTGKEISNS